METTENKNNSEDTQVVHVDNTVLMSVLSYIGILVLIPLLTAKENETVRFHIKQGLVLLVLETGIWIIGEMVWILKPILAIVYLASIILAIIGIVNALQKKQAELPLVGKFAKHFTI